MKVSGSIFAVKSDYFEYAKMLKEANVDYLHIDIFQGQKDFLLKQLLEFDHTYLPLDVHLIFSKITDDDIDILNRSNVHFLNIQYETLEDKMCISHIQKEFYGNFGVAFTAKTPLSVVEENVKYISQILFMCSEPGVSGAKFNEENYNRIEKIHDLYPTLNLCADGGINNLISKRMEKLGVEMVVSGSYLCKDIDMLNINSFKIKYLNEMNVSVTRNMVKRNFLPILSDNADFFQIIDVMNHFRMGIVFIEKSDIFKGVITDGDIRRGLLAYGRDIVEKKADDIINSSPLIVNCDNTMEELFIKISENHKGIDVVPVCENNKLIGAVDFKIGL